VTPLFCWDSPWLRDVRATDFRFSIFIGRSARGSRSIQLSKPNLGIFVTDLKKNRYIFEDLTTPTGSRKADLATNRNGTNVPAPEWTGRRTCGIRIDATR